MDKVIRIGKYDVTQQPDLFGIRYWVWHSNDHPRLHIVVYEGYVLQRPFNLHFFKSRVNGRHLYMPANEIFSKGFHPFLLNLEKVRKYIESDAILSP